MPGLNDSGFDSLSEIMRKIPLLFLIRSRSKAYASILKTLVFVSGCYGLIVLASHWYSWMKWPLGLDLKKVTQTL